MKLRKGYHVMQYRQPLVNINDRWERPVLIIRSTFAANIKEIKALAKEWIHGEYNILITKQFILEK